MLDNTTPIRIAAIFTIFVTSLLTGILPLVFKVLQNPTSWPTRIIRAFGAGVILALALVHIIPECIERLGGLTSYESLGGIVIIGGIFLVLALEHLITTFASEGDFCSHGLKSNGSNPSVPVIESNLDEEAAGNSFPAADIIAVPNLHLNCCPPKETVKDSKSGAKALAWYSSSDNGEGSRLKVMAYLFEFGCIFHSVIVGIDLGVNSSNMEDARALFVALVFHQALEGISLGTVIVQGRFFGLRGLAMVVAYSITCPIGIAIGMGISSSYDEESYNAVVVQGVFDGIAGGMLLYVSLVQLIAEDMSHIERGSKSGVVRIVTLLGMAVGAALMSILAIWA